MTDAKRKAKILLLQRNDTFDDVAMAADLALATVHNVLDGKASSRKSRQAITNALGAEIWPGMVPMERAFVMPAGTEIDTVGDDAAAQQWLDEFPGRLERRGKILVFTKRTALIIRKDVASGSYAIANPKSVSSDERDQKHRSATTGPNKAQ